MAKLLVFFVCLIPSVLYCSITSAYTIVFTPDPPPIAEAATWSDEVFPDGVDYASSFDVMLLSDYGNDSDLVGATFTFDYILQIESVGGQAGYVNVSAYITGPTANVGFSETIGPYLDVLVNSTGDRTISMAVGELYTVDLFARAHLYSGDNLDGQLSYASIALSDLAIPAEVAAIPEPSTMLLLASGLIGLAGFRRKFKK